MWLKTVCDWDDFTAGGSENPQSWNREGRPPECRVNIRCWRLLRQKDIPFHQIKDLRGAAGVLRSPFHSDFTSILWESLRLGPETLDVWKRSIIITLFSFSTVQKMWGRVRWFFSNILPHVQAFCVYLGRCLLPYRSLFLAPHFLLPFCLYTFK